MRSARSSSSRARPAVPGTHPVARRGLRAVFLLDWGAVSIAAPIFPPSGLRPPGAAPSAEQGKAHVPAATGRLPELVGPAALDPWKDAA